MSTIAFPGGGGAALGRILAYLRRGIVYAHAYPVTGGQDGPIANIADIGVLNNLGGNGSASFFLPATNLAGLVRLETSSESFVTWNCRVPAATGNASFGLIGVSGNAVLNRGQPVGNLLIPTMAGNIRLHEMGVYFLETDIKITTVEGNGSRRLIAGVTLADPGSPLGGAANGIIGLLYISDQSPNLILAFMTGYSQVAAPRIHMAIDTGLPALGSWYSVRLEWGAESFGSGFNTFVRAIVDGATVAEQIGPLIINPPPTAAERWRWAATLRSLGVCAYKDSAAVNNDEINCFAGATQGLRFGWVPPGIR